MSTSSVMQKNISPVTFLAKPGDPLPHIDANVVEIRNFKYLMQAMGWRTYPILEGGHLHHFKDLSCVNDRRLHDAEVLGAACCGSPKTLLEIGTLYGHATALMARNAPEGTVYTVNIPPEEIEEGGKRTTRAPSREEIGRYYRESGLTNIVQILANTAVWEPDIGTIDVAYIDGCHDAGFTYNDTKKILRHCRPDSLILWHDFNPASIKIHDIHSEVCRGINQLYADGLLKNKILHLQDSWVGLYRVP